jgi:hypothetical protein
MISLFPDNENIHKFKRMAQFNQIKYKLIKTQNAWSNFVMKTMNTYQINLKTDHIGYNIEENDG